MPPNPSANASETLALVGAYRLTSAEFADKQSLTSGTVKAYLLAGRANLPLFNTQGRVRQLQAAFELMHQNALFGECPKSISLTA